MKMKVKKGFVWGRVFSCLPPDMAKVTIPSGAPVTQEKSGEYYVCPSFFDEGSIERHDATYRGCRVSPFNVEVS